jgi:GNAT superfamily N-acetyltransferase
MRRKSAGNEFAGLFELSTISHGSTPGWCSHGIWWINRPALGKPTSGRFSAMKQSRQATSTLSEPPSECFCRLYWLLGISVPIIVSCRSALPISWLFHFFIDRHSQGRGYGKEALRLLLEFIRDHHPQCQALHLTVHPENEAALRLSISVGFQPTGAIFSDEPVYRLSCKS